MASDNVILQPGIDNDDYVLLTFDKAVNNVTVTALNVDSIFPLSSGHTWLSGFGTIGSAVWNPSFTKLLITLSVTVSAPTISVGDSIWFALGQGKAVLTGSFDPPSSTRSRIASVSAGALRIEEMSGSVYFSCPQRVNLRIVDLKGHCIADLGPGTAFTWDRTGAGSRVATGIYCAQLTSGKRAVACEKFFVP